MAKIKVDDALFERVRRIADQAGYASADEFVVHVLEKEMSKLEAAESDEQVTERLKGLGYLE
jgi:hypothetical protein